MDLQLADRTFIVTGGSAGLGFATAQSLVADGARVVVSSRDPQHCADAVAALGDHAIAFPGDNADPSFAERVLAAARAASEIHIPLRRYGRPDEFGDVAAFVLSPRSSYLTGCLVPVEGGALRAL